ncbi:hypothetical protein KVR801_90301 [Klebsiella variicola]|nr:hypothetical protein KVR801_90301 [Klebsiella variicola]
MTSILGLELPKSLEIAEPKIGK